MCISSAEFSTEPLQNFNLVASGSEVTRRRSMESRLPLRYLQHPTSGRAWHSRESEGFEATVARLKPRKNRAASRRSAGQQTKRVRLIRGNALSSERSRGCSWDAASWGLQWADDEMRLTEQPSQSATADLRINSRVMNKRKSAQRAIEARQDKMQTPKAKSRIVEEVQLA